MALSFKEYEYLSICFFLFFVSFFSDLHTWQLAGCEKAARFAKALLSHCHLYNTKNVINITTKIIFN